MSLRIITWNVNSLRSALRKGFSEWLEKTSPDIVCLQEVRAELKHLHPLESLFPEHRAIWHPAVRPGYSGVAILSRFEPTNIEYGLNGASDLEGRALTVDYGSFRVTSLYGPNATEGTPKFLIKRAWLEELSHHVAKRADKPLIIAGDLNVAHTALDSRGVSHPSGIRGCTDEERHGFQELLDTCQLFDPMRERAGTSIISTWWHAGITNRQPEQGIRFDYTLLGTEYRDLVLDHTIHPEVFGSDHCPVSLIVEIPTDQLRLAHPVGQTALV